VSRLSSLGASALSLSPLLITGAGPLAAEPEPAPNAATELTVTEARSPPAPSSDDASSGNAFSLRTIELLAGASHTSPYRVLDHLPSIHVEGTDGLGVGVDQNAVRVRGQLGDTYARLASTVEGVPLSFNVAKGVMGNLVDLQNVDGVSFYRGPVPSDTGFGLGTTAGALDLHILRPSRRPAVRSMTTTGLVPGAHPMLSAFLRVDPGPLAWGTTAFVSGSYNRAEKWRGFGQIERFNGTVGLAKSVGRSVDIELFGMVSRTSENEYRPLTYAQTQDPSLYRSFDYTNDLTYLDYRNNRQSLTEGAVLAKLTGSLSSWGRLAATPYIAATDGVRYFGSEPNPKVNGVNRMVLLQRQFGVLADLRFWPREGFEVALGTWAAALDTVPPPEEQKFYDVLPSGELAFARWNILARTGTRVLVTPYLVASGKVGKLRIDAGLKLVVATMPSVTGYDATNVGDVSASQAMDQQPPVRPGLHADARTQTVALPHVGMRYAWSSGVSARAVYGRNYAYPFQGPLFSTYSSNAESFGNLGLTLNDIWRGLKLETSDNFDLGIDLEHRGVGVRPTVYYAFFHDKQVLAFDPDVGVPYYQNVASAKAAGAELEAWLSPCTWLTLAFAGSYNRTTFTHDLATKSSTPLATTGKQFADAPSWLAKASATVDWRRWQVSSFFRYVGTRYGDVMNTERIAGHEILDLMVGYRIGRAGWLRELAASLRVQNVLDARYIGIISNQQDISEALSTTYYPGSPRSVMLVLDARLAQ
jgi:iron complex outermembrane recepter protein